MSDATSGFKTTATLSDAQRSNSQEIHLRMGHHPRLGPAPTGIAGDGHQPYNRNASFSPAGLKPLPVAAGLASDCPGDAEMRRVTSTQTNVSNHGGRYV